jgi:hypothetical protein
VKHRPPFFVDGFNSPKSSGESTLWKAVILQALQDAVCGSKKAETGYHKRMARQWLKGTTKHFYTICSLADLDPDCVKEKAKECIERGWVIKNREVLIPKSLEGFFMEP